MPRYIEQLEVKDLKEAFQAMLKDSNIASIYHKKWWDLFWDRLKDKCSLVERI